MTASRLGIVIDYLYQSTASRGDDGQTDGRLLAHFTATGDEASFAALVCRHGSLVLSVCRGVLRDEHDAEDAFQATFLVLVKKARAIRKRESLRSWLYGVAHRVAVRAKAARARRLEHERQVVAMPIPDPGMETARQEMGQLLHEEVVRLPERYRLPVLLCCLEGKSRQEAARELGWTEGAVKGRLERGRRRLHARLARRGLAPAVAAAAVDLSRGVAPACVPPRLVASTTKAAAQLAAGRAAAGLVSVQVATLTQGVLQTMSFTKLRVSAVVLLVLTVVAAGAGLFTGRMVTPKAGASAPAGKPAHPAGAGDNILGLVPPRDPGRPGAVMLHGGGDLTDEHVAWFLKLAGGKDARIVLVPSAYFGPTGHDRREFAATMKQRFGYWFRLASAGRIAHFELLYTDDPADADDPAFVRPLASATGVWFFGGNQSRLNYRYVDHFPGRTRFQEALRDVLRRGGVVGGTSAGMAALPEIMTLDQQRRGDSGPYRAVAAHGLGLFDGAIVEQHFNTRNGRLERFTGLLRDSARLDRLAGRVGAGRRMLGLAVESSTALVVQADRLEVLGAGNAHVFIKSRDGRTIHWQTLGSGDRSDLKRDARGNVVLAPAR